MIDRSGWGKGTRIAWWAHPTRQQQFRTGTLAGVSWSKRTGMSWAVECDQEEGRTVIVLPKHNPFPLVAWEALEVGDSIQFAEPMPEVLSGRLLVRGIGASDLEPGICWSLIAVSGASFAVSRPVGTEVMLLVKRVV